MFKNLFNFKKENFSEEKVHALFKLGKNDQPNKQTHPLIINGHRSNTSGIYSSHSSGFGGTGVPPLNYAGTYRNFEEIETYFNNLSDDKILQCGGRCNMKKGEYTTVKHKETGELLYPDGVLNKLRRDYNNLVRDGKITGPELELDLTPTPTTRAPTTPAPTTTTRPPTTPAPTTRAPTTAASTTAESTKKATSGKSNTGLIVGVTVGVLLIIVILMYLQKKGIINIPFLRKI